MDKYHCPPPGDCREYFLLTRYNVLTNVTCVPCVGWSMYFCLLFCLWLWGSVNPRQDKLLRVFCLKNLMEHRVCYICCCHKATRDKLVPVSCFTARLCKLTSLRAAWYTSVAACTLIHIAIWNSCFPSVYNESHVSPMTLFFITINHDTNGQCGFQHVWEKEEIRVGETFTVTGYRNRL